ncbi:DUF6678 family protein [Flavobacterium rhizosphaerae]|uniref:DUF6678 family protein n=1 Tax=Flavobacterium rhizosphaerae TaxID=3163298 RepID=A0ABW8YXA7_9FLAO
MEKNENINKFIGEKFNGSFMNNTKWDKLLKALTETVGEIVIQYKLIYKEEICLTTFIMPDIKPFFLEPILYKEIEWVEFPAEYNMPVNTRESRKKINIKIQDVSLIKKIINETGQYITEERDERLRLYAYR